MVKVLSLRFWSIPQKLLLLLLIVFLPASGVIVYSSLEHRSDTIREAKNRDLLLVRSLAAQQEQFTAATKQMLTTLAYLPQVKNLDAEACNEIFGELKEKYPIYSFIGMTTPDGNVFASDAPFDPGTNLSDRKYVREVISTLDFSVGEYNIGRISRMPTIHFAYPVLGANKELAAIIIAGLNLENYAHFLKMANLPGDSSVSITDHNGVRLFRFPENKGVSPGNPLPENAFRQMSGSLDQGTFEGTGGDGLIRFYAFKRLSLREGAPAYLYVRVGTAKQAIYQSVNRNMLVNLSFLGVLGLLSVCLVWISAHHLLLRPINQLVEAAQAFGQGKMGTRTGLAHSPDEVGRLAGSLDDMASLLEWRQIQRKRAGEVLRESEEKFRLLVENAPDAIFVQVRGLFAYVNPAAVKLFGAASADELTGKSNLDRIHPDSRKKVIERIRQLNVERNSLPRDEQEFIRFDGAAIYVETSAVPINYGGENGALVFVRDISQRKRAEKEREHLSRLNKLILDAVSEGIIGVDAEGKGIFANPSATSILGYEPEELLGKDIHDLIHHTKSGGSVHPRSECITLTSLKTGRTSPKIEDFFWKKNGEGCPVSFSCTPMIEAGGVIGVVLNFRDITQHKKDEETKAMLEIKLWQAQKLEAIGTLAGGIAHDFNNILSPIIGYTEIGLQDVAGSTPLVRNGLEQVLKAGLRAKDLVKQILTFSRPGRESEMVPVEISVSVKEVLKLMRSSLPASIEIRHNLGEGHALADPTQIHQVLMNLCVNAVHAMEDHGVLEVDLTRIELGESDLQSLSLLGVKPGPHLKLSVSDTGSGMDGATMQRIFEPYFTTKEAGKGTGLGLAVVHGIVKRHQGAVSVQSIVGEGTTFNIYIPEIERENEDPSRPDEELAGGNETILLIDDEPIMVELGSLILERLGYQVSAETDGLKALELFRDNPGRFDLIITDCTMPNLAGTELAKEVHLIRPDIPIILCTGLCAMAGVAEELGLEHILKPFVTKDMANLIRKVLDRAD